MKKIISLAKQRTKKKEKIMQKFVSQIIATKKINIDDLQHIETKYYRKEATLEIKLVFDF